jgi:hypothetical protein
MRNLLRFAGLFALLAALPAVHAADVSGTWKGAFDFEGSNVPLTFHLTVAGAAVTGTVGGLPTTPAEIHDGKIDGDTVTFWVNTDYQGQTYKLLFTGKISAAGDAIAFTFGTEDLSWSAQLTATKSTDKAAAPSPAANGPDVTGTWKGAFDFQGSSVPLTFHLKGAAGAVTGTVEGLPTTPAEIYDGKIDGDTVTFSVNTDYQGQTYKLVYTGKIREGQIAFTFGVEDGSWGAELTAVKAGT